MHVSKSLRLDPPPPPAAAAAAAAAERRGIYRRKFPVAKTHDLYIGIGRSTSQRPNCFQTAGRGVCQRKFAAAMRAAGERTHDAYTANIIYHSGMRNAAARPSDAPVNQRFTNLSRPEVTPYI